LLELNILNAATLFSKSASIKAGGVRAFSRLYLSNGQAIGMVVVRPFVRLSVMDVLWLSCRSQKKAFYINN